MPWDNMDVCNLMQNRNKRAYKVNYWLITVLTITKISIIIYSNQDWQTNTHYLIMYFVGVKQLKLGTNVI